MEQKIILTILAEDIWLDNYTNCYHCPITKALHRAGFINLKDTGHISGYIGNIINRQRVDIRSSNNESYKELVSTLFGMYKSFSPNFKNIEVELIPVASFSHTITYNT